MKAGLPSHRTGGLLVFFGALIACTWPFPYFPELGSPNELSRLYLARAIVDDGTFALDGQVRRWGTITDLATRDGRLYSDKAPGIAFMAVPFYTVARAVAGPAIPNGALLRLLRIVLAAVPTALTCVLLFFMLQRLGLGHSARFWLVAVYLLGSVAYPYGVMLFGHQAAAFCLLFAAWRTSGHGRPSPGQLVLAGFALGASLMLEYTTALLVIPLGIYGLWRWKLSVRGALLLLAGSLPPLAMLAAYNWSCFGSPLSTGYQHLLHESFARIHSRGLVGLTHPSLARLADVTFGTTRGLFFWSPWLLLAPAGILAGLYRPAALGWRPLWIAIAASSLLYLLFASCLQTPAWGWSLGPRHLAPLVPFWTLAAGRCVCPEAGWRKGAHVLSCGLGLYSSAATVAAVCVFGGFPPDFSNPLADFVFPLATSGCTGPSLGSQLGLAPQVAMWGFYATVMTLLLLLVWKQKMSRSGKMSAIAAGIALLLAAATWTGPSSEREERSRRWVSCEILRCCENSHAAEEGGRSASSPWKYPKGATAGAGTSPLPRR